VNVRTTSIARLVETARDPAAPLHAQHTAFSQLVARTQHMVFGLAFSTFHNADEAKDVAQDVFAAAWLHLRQLRDPAAFSAWLKRIVATQCSRRLRRRTDKTTPVDLAEPVAAEMSPSDYQSLVACAVAALPDAERHVTVLYYFLGHTQPEIARLLRRKPGTVGKQLHSARLRIRRTLPPSVRGEFVRLRPSPAFIQQVRLGLFNEYVGTYRFARRPELVVSILREGELLISEARGQRNVLTSFAADALRTSQYDGEGRFVRGRDGRVTHFVYYEFGRRLGIAKKTRHAP